jgi:hypothetical protein
MDSSLNIERRLCASPIKYENSIGAQHQNGKGDKAGKNIRRTAVSQAVLPRFD